MRVASHSFGPFFVRDKLYTKPLRIATLLFFAPRMGKKTKKKTALSRYLSKIGQKGGKARLQTMTEDERKESARKAVQARWAKKKSET